MGQAPKLSFLRKAVLAAWAMFTLILLFCVLLLANELMKSGKSPLNPAEIEQKEDVAAQVAGASSELGSANIYVISADGAALVPERRSIPLGGAVAENCKAALDELKKPTQGGSSIPVLPPSAEVNALYLLPTGELVIDFRQGLRADMKRSAEAEALMVYGVVDTMTQEALKGPKGETVKTVRFLIDGEAPRELFPEHLDLSRPIARDAQWILKTEATG